MTLAQWLATYGGQIILGTVFGGVAIVMLLESAFPWRATPDIPLVRWLNNIALTIIDYALLLGLSPVLAMWLGSIPGLPHAGLFQSMDLPRPLGFLLTFLALELVGYWLHRAFHAVPWLWRIHAVHHSDIDFDATTAHRHHPFEPLLSSLVAMPVVLALGAEPIMLLAYNVARLAVAALTHGNLSYAPAVDARLRRVLVTPDFHRLHHMAERRYTDSNYAGIFAFLDHLFGTASDADREAQRGMRLGLDRFAGADAIRLDRLLWLPFSGKFSR